MTWFLGMDTRLQLGRERFERVEHGMDYWHVALMAIDKSRAPERNEIPIQIGWEIAHSLSS
jgi:hypothetical protein